MEDVSTQQRVVRQYRLLLRACSTGETPVSHGEALHAYLFKSSTFSVIPSLKTAIFHMYAAVACSPSALVRAFHSLPPSLRGTAEWTALSSSLCRRHNLSDLALRTFRCTRRIGLLLDVVSLLSAISASARVANPSTAAAAHIVFLKTGLPFSVPACNSLAHAYAFSGFLLEAQRVVAEMEQPTVVSWTVLLSGMIRWKDATSRREFFEQMPLRNVVSWTLMISSCVQDGQTGEALLLLARLLFGGERVEGFQHLNHISCCSLLAPCSQLGDLIIGRWLHAHIIKSDAPSKFSDNEMLILGTALIDMYGKCGRVRSAYRIFQTMKQKNVIAYNAMLGVQAMHGMGLEAVQLFTKMTVEERLQPDEITFVCVLSACCHSGLIEQGRKIFSELAVYDCIPAVEHYACMVDLLGRAGCIEEAEMLAKNMPMRPNKVVLGSLISSCTTYRKVERGGTMMRRLLQTDPNNTECHVLLSNLYASCGRHCDAEWLRGLMAQQGSSKIPAWSYSEADFIGKSAGTVR